MTLSNTKLVSPSDGHLHCDYAVSDSWVLQVASYITILQRKPVTSSLVKCMHVHYLEMNQISVWPL